jgi:hypothetical protein
MRYLRSGGLPSEVSENFRRTSITMIGLPLDATQDDSRKIWWNQRIQEFGTTG